MQLDGEQLSGAAASDWGLVAGEWEEGAEKLWEPLLPLPQHQKEQH